MDNNNVASLLREKVALEKKAYTDYVSNFTSTAIVNLVKGGLAFEKASELVKAACEENSEVKAMFSTVELFEKTAEYVESLELKIGELEKFAEEVEIKEEINSSAPLTKLAQAGFTKEDLERLADLPEELIEKVANSNTTPYSMGSGVGMKIQESDPMLNFILGRD